MDKTNTIFSQDHIIELRKVQIRYQCSQDSRESTLVIFSLYQSR